MRVTPFFSNDNDNKSNLYYGLDKIFCNILGQWTPGQFEMADCMEMQKEIMELDAAVFIALT